MLVSEGLSPIDLVPAGGTWSGLLFDNPQIGRPLSLTWGFTIEYAEVEREYGATTPSLTADWISFDLVTWREMTGNRVHGVEFGDAVEASAYFFGHHRYDTVDLAIIDQRETELRVALEVTGDVDGLGLDVITAEDWLQFGGIVVAPTRKPRSAQAARRLLGRLIDTTGLIAEDRGRSYAFVPDTSR